MKASALITKLKELKEIHGDLDVQIPDWNEELGVFDGSSDYVEYIHTPLLHERYFRIS